MTSCKLCKILKMTFLILSMSSVLLALWSYGMADTANGLQICPLLSEQNNFLLEPMASNRTGNLHLGIAVEPVSSPRLSSCL